MSLEPEASDVTSLRASAISLEPGAGQVDLRQCSLGVIDLRQAAAFGAVLSAAHVQLLGGWILE